MTMIRSVFVNLPVWFVTPPTLEGLETSLHQDYHKNDNDQKCVCKHTGVICDLNHPCRNVILPKMTMIKCVCKHTSVYKEQGPSENLCAADHNDRM